MDCRIFVGFLPVYASINVEEITVTILWTLFCILFCMYSLKNWVQITNETFLWLPQLLYD